MKLVYLESTNDLVFLFSYDIDFDYERYEVSSKRVYINRKNGVLYNFYVVNRDGGSMRPGAASEYPYEMSYDEFHNLLRTKEIKDSTKYESLHEDNWHDWLMNWSRD